MVILDPSVLLIFSFGRFGTVCNKICNVIRDFSHFYIVSEPEMACRKSKTTWKLANAKHVGRELSGLMF